MVEIGGHAGAARVGRFRRVVALAVFVASAVALLATSYSPVQSTLAATHQGSVDLSEDSPRATGRVRLDLSAEALPEDDPPRRVAGEVRFSTWQTDDVAIVVSAVGHDALPTEELGVLTFPIGQVCRVAEPCEVEFEVVLERTSSDGNLSAATFTAEVEIIYEEVERNPDGASASWTETSAMANEPAGTLETAATDPERITLDEDAFAASRHLMVSASETARRGETAVVVVVGPSRPAPGRVLVTVRADEPGGTASSGAEPIDPFVSCPSNDRCERALTVTFHLTGERQIQPATIEWHAEVRATFPAADDVPVDAAVDIAIDDTGDVTEQAPRVVKGVDGSSISDGEATVAIRIDASAGALPARGFAGMPPTSLATLAMRSDFEGSLQVDVVGGETTENVGTVKFGPDRFGEVIFNPLASCPLDRACIREVILSIAPIGTDVGVVDVDWGFELEIAYPGLDEVPVGADVDLVAEERTR